MEHLPSRESGLSRVVGTEENQERLFREFKELFGNQELLNRESIKSPEETEMLNEVLQFMPEFIAGYGAESFVPITPEHFHFFDLKGMLGEEKKIYDEVQIGSHNGAKQNVLVLKYGGPSGEIVTAETAVHEAMHFNSFNSRSAYEEGSSPRRSGLTINSGGMGDKLYAPEMTYFTVINEGVTEELTRRFVVDKVSEIALLREYCEDNKIESEDILTHIENVTDSSVYAMERETMWEICNRLSKSDPEEFPTPEAVFRLLAKGYFTGRLLEIARAVDRSQGKGTFKKWAHNLGEPDSYKFVDNGA